MGILLSKWWPSVLSIFGEPLQCLERLHELQWCAAAPTYAGHTVEGELEELVFIPENELTEL